MPKGAKKRKAALKKKANEANNNNSATHSHGDDDLKVRDEKESDGGEVSSPTSQDHHNDQHPFNEGEEEERENTEDTSSLRSMAAENEHIGVNGNGEIAKKVVMEVNNATQIDKKLQLEDGFESKNFTNECVESEKESNGGWITQDGGSSSSNSGGGSSSDDESHVVEKNIVMIESGKSKNDVPNLVAASGAVADFEKIADLPEVTQVTDAVPVVNAFKLAVGEAKEEVTDPVTENTAEVYLDVLADLPEVTQVKESVPVVEVYSLAAGKSTEEASKYVVETDPLVDLEHVSKEEASAGDSKCSSVLDGGLKVNGENESSGVSSVEMDTGAQPNEDILLSVGIENSDISAASEVLEAQEYREVQLQASSVLAASTSNDAEHMKDSVVIESSDKQLLIASAPRPLQTSFLKSCCGMFEVFTGSKG